METNISSVLENLKSLSPDEIRERLVQLGQEEKTLRVLLRSRLVAESTTKTIVKDGSNQ
jgi:VIT1/CCC1 family predicted Fe2+/Mn2+ transporter